MSSQFQQIRENVSHDTLSLFSKATLIYLSICSLERPLVNYTGKGHVKFKTVLLSPFSFVSITEQITRNVSFEWQEKIADV